MKWRAKSKCKGKDKSRSKNKNESREQLCRIKIHGHRSHTFYIKIYSPVSGKYNLNLIRAAVEDAGAEIITLALCRVILQRREYSGLIFRRGYTAAEHFRYARKCRRGWRHRHWYEMGMR